MSKSWRRDSSGTAPKQAGRYWQEQQKPTSAEDAAKRRRWKLAGLFLGLFGLLALLVGRLLFLPGDLVVLPITVHYAATVDLDSGPYQAESGVRGLIGSPIPVNGLAGEDAQTLKNSLLTNFQVKDAMDANMDRFSTPEDFLREFAGQLRELRAVGPHIFHKTVVIYLSGHGVVDKDENPCLLMANSDPRNCGHWLKVESLIKEIQDCPNLKGTNVVLLLDSSRIRDCWPIGVFENDFAERLRVTVENTENDHLFVVNSASSGQQAWTSPELNGTVFGYFVAKGLAGEANKSGKTVTLQELVAYLQTNVGEFARQFRNSSQQPFLVTGKNAPDDVALAYAISKSIVEVPEPDIQLEQERSESVSGLWDRFERVHADAAYRFQPLRFAKVADRLIRLEDLIIAGESYTSQFDNVLEDTTDELDELAKARDSYTDYVITAAAMARLKQYQDLATPREEFLQWLKDRKDPEKKTIRPNHNGELSALVAWDWLENLNEVTADDIETAENYVGQATEKTPRLLSELHYVRLVDAYLPWRDGPDWPELVGRSFSVLRTTEELAAPEDIRSFYWVRERLDEIEQNLRAARDQLFVGSDAKVESASQVWNRMAPVEGGGELAEVELSERTITRAYRARDASLALIPYFGRWAASYDRESLPIVTRLIEGTRRLCEQLDRQATEIDETALVDTQKALNEMQRRYEGRCKECLDAGNRDVSQETLREITELLSIPIPTPGAGYHNKLRQILMTHRWAVPADIYANRQLAADGETQSTQRLQARQHPAAKMLLVGDDAGSLAALGGHVRSHLESVAATAKGLAMQTDARMDSGRDLADPRAARKSLSEADQRYRWAAPFLPAYSKDNNYVAQLWKYDHHFFLLWQGQRALRDLWGPEPGADSDTRSFFAQAVGGAVANAKRLYFPASQHREQLLTAAADATQAIRDWVPLKFDDVKLFDDPSAQGGYVNHSLEFEPLAAGQMSLKSELQIDNGEPAIFIENSGRPFPWFNPDFTGAAKVPFGRQSPADSRLSYAFDRVALSGEPDLVAITLFRGHLKNEPLAVKAGIEAVVFHRPRPSRTSVLVAGDRGTKTQIMFVLDCSASMGPKKALGRVDKMNPARNALFQILGQIAADEKIFDVGLFAFGRRFRDERAPRDVEELVALGPAEANVGAIRAEIRTLKPFGYTPLYRSISDASAAIRKYGRRGKKLLIVITDGENYIPPAALGITEKEADDLGQKSATAAGAAVDSSDIQVEIVGFGVGLGGGLLQGPTLPEFANRSRRITFLNANKIEDVKQRIINAIGLKTYTVTGPGSPPKALNLGEFWQTTSTSLGDYTVTVRNGPSESITLLGGEAIEMSYENNRLRHNPYREEDPQKRADGHLLRFHTNGYDGSEFGISMQKEDRRFTARPRRAFMTIRPDGTDDVFFYGHEMEFELRRPVPVMHYQLIGWPQDRARASIQVSYSMSDPIGVPTVALNLADNTLKQPFKNVSLKLSTTPSQDNGPVRVIIDEIHEAESRLFPLHLAFQPEPLTARHSLARKSRGGGYEVTHVFLIEPERLQNTQASLQLTTPSERRDNWVRVAPVTVDVHHWTTRK